MPDTSNGAGIAIPETSDTAELDEAILSEDRGVQVDSWGMWCRLGGPPHVERLARDYEYEWRMVAVYIEKNPELVEIWSIKATPTLTYLRYGEERHRTAGSVTPSMVEEAVNSVV